MTEVNTPATLRHTAQNAMDAGRIAEAVDAWRELLWLRPDDLEALVGLAACGEVKAAIEGLQSAVRKNPDDGQAQYQLGLLWLELGEWDKAEQALHRARDDAATAAALKQLEAQRGKLGGTYARHLFNDYASRFEEALAKLGYQAPQLIAAALQPYLKTSQRIIDLGCGTGLMAPYLKPHAAELVGVDIAEKMLAIAAARQLYDRLEAGDMVAALVAQYDIIVAADAVVYVGDLQPLFTAVAKTLAPDGVFALTIEVNGLMAGYELQESKRYAHSLAYITATAAVAGLSIISAENVTLRQDRGQPVVGAVVILKNNPVF